MGDKVRYQQANTNFSVIVILIDVTKLKIFTKKKLQIKKKKDIFFSMTTFCFNLFFVFCFALFCFVFFFNLLLGWHGNFGPLWREQPVSLNVNSCILL